MRTVIFSLLVSLPCFAATLQVGPGKTYAKPCLAIAAAAAGDTIEVDAAGNYAGDSCGWTKDNLTVRGVNGRAKIDATGVTLSNGKGIFVIAAEPAAATPAEEVAAAERPQAAAVVTPRRARPCSCSACSNSAVAALPSETTTSRPPEARAPRCRQPWPPACPLPGSRP
jgi:hypothetical protein